MCERSIEEQIEYLKSTISVLSSSYKVTVKELGRYAKLKKLESSLPRKSTMRAVFVIVILSFLGAAGALKLIPNLFGDGPYSYMSTIPTWLQIVVVGFSGCAIFVIPMAIYTVVIKTLISIQKTMLSSLQKKEDEVYDKNSDLLKDIPKEYCQLPSVCFFIAVLQNGRAESMKEAMNLYETKLHQEKMEYMQREVLDINREQRQMLNEIGKISYRARLSNILIAGAIISCVLGRE